jgi:hypothetical protein
MPAESFLDRYSLPRIARLIATNIDDNQYHQQNSNNNSGSGSKKVSTVHQFVQQQQVVETISNDEKLQNNNNTGELFLLYRHQKKCRVYHGVNAKSGSNNRKKGIKIPQDFLGKFVV